MDQSRAASVLRHGCWTGKGIGLVGEDVACDFRVSDHPLDLLGDGSISLLPTALDLVVVANPDQSTRSLWQRVGQLFAVNVNQVPAVGGDLGRRGTREEDVAI